jgi:GT2 family glycosyltransferase
MGNDVLAYPYAIDNLIHVAETTDYDWVCPREVSVFTLLKAHPELKELFAGRELRITPEDLQKRPWEAFDEYKNDPSYCDIRFSQTHNMCLYKKSVFDKVGYIDVNFYPAYFEDNDLVKRALLTDLKSCTLNHTFYFHFWSRTINQETGGSNSKFFSLNSNFYIKKWGGPFLKETYSVPFNGESNFFNLGGIKIDSREREQEVINYWKETK